MSSIVPATCALKVYDAPRRELELECLREELHAAKVSKQLLTSQVARLMVTDGLRKAEVDQLKRELEELEMRTAAERESLEDALMGREDFCSALLDESAGENTPPTPAADEASYLSRASSQQSRCGDNYAASLLSGQTVPGDSEVPKILLELLTCCSALTNSCKEAESEDVCKPSATRLIPVLVQMTAAACGLDLGQREDSQPLIRDRWAVPDQGLTAALNSLENLLRSQHVNESLCRGALVLPIPSAALCAEAGSEYSMETKGLGWAVQKPADAAVSLAGMSCGFVKGFLEETDTYSRRFMGISVIDVITKLTALSFFIMRGAVPAPLVNAAARLGARLLSDLNEIDRL